MQESAEQYFNRLRYFGDASDYKDLQDCYENNTQWNGNEYSKKEYPADMPEDKDILFCWIAHYSGYEGSLAVAYRKDGKFYVHSDGHCSCNGWDEAWGPENDTEVSMEWIVQELLKEKPCYELTHMPIESRRILADYLQERFVT